MSKQHKFILTTDAETNAIVSIQQLGSAGELVDLPLSSLNRDSVVASPELTSTSAASQSPAVGEASPGVFLQNELHEVQETSPGIFLQNELPEETSPGIFVQNELPEAPEATPGVFFQNELPEAPEATPGVFFQNELPQLH